MQRQNVESSMIASVGFEPSTSTLEIEFKSNGAVWQYYEVPESVFNELIGGSVGKYFHSNILGQYSESQVG
jgi:hypothetical protein